MTAPEDWPFHRYWDEGEEIVDFEDEDQYYEEYDRLDDEDEDDYYYDD